MEGPCENQDTYTNLKKSETAKKKKSTEVSKTSALTTNEMQSH